MFIKHILPFFSPDAPGGTPPVENTDDSLSRDLADLSGDPGDEDDAREGDGEEEPKPKAKKKEVAEDDEEEESEEEKVDEEEEDEEKKEAKEDDGARPSVKAILKKYPNVFKDFPQLRSAFFLAPKFLEVFPDPESAVEASTKAVEYDALENSLVAQGDPSILLKTLNENNPKALAKVVENFAGAVREIDNTTYMKLATPIIEELLYYASEHGTKGGDKNLVLAAKHLANYVFANGGEIPDVSKWTGKKEPHPAEAELEKERQTHANEKFGTAVESIGAQIDPEINQAITAKLTDLTAFERRGILKEVRTEIDTTLSADKAFQSQMRGLWKRAQETNYDRASLSRIKSAWLERAKAIAPGIRNRLRQEALDSRQGEGNSEDGEKKKRSFTNSSGRAPSGRKVGSTTDPKKVDWRKTSDMDILNS